MQLQLYVLGSYSGAKLQVCIVVSVVHGAVEQAAAVQLVLQGYPGLIAHQVPRGGQQLLLQSTNNGTGSTTLIQ